jgi:hypothetical protein
MIAIAIAGSIILGLIGLWVGLDAHKEVAALKKQVEGLTAGIMTNDICLNDTLLNHSSRLEYNEAVVKKATEIQKAITDILEDVISKVNQQRPPGNPPEPPQKDVTINVNKLVDKVEVCTPANAVKAEMEAILHQASEKKRKAAKEVPKWVDPSTAPANELPRESVRVNTVTENPAAGVPVSESKGACEPLTEPCVSNHTASNGRKVMMLAGYRNSQGEWNKTESYPVGGDFIRCPFQCSIVGKEALIQSTSIEGEVIKSTCQLSGSFVDQADQLRRAEYRLVKPFLTPNE